MSAAPRRPRRERRVPPRHGGRRPDPLGRSGPQGRVPAHGVRRGGPGHGRVLGPPRVAHYSRLGVEAVPLQVLDRAGADDPALAGQVAGAGLVYLSGGNPGTSPTPRYLADTPVPVTAVPRWRDALRARPRSETSAKTGACTGKVGAIDRDIGGGSRPPRRGPRRAWAWPSSALRRRRGRPGGEAAVGLRRWARRRPGSRRWSDRWP